MGRIQLGLPVILLLGATAVYSDEQVDGVDDEPRRCINTGSILRTRIIDDSNIVFIMRGDKMYLNTLRKPCSGLARGGSFYYATPTRSLCEMERIGHADYMTVGRSLGGRCALGIFKRTSLEDLERIFAPRFKEPETREVNPPSIEEFDTEDDGGETAEPAELGDSET